MFEMLEGLLTSFKTTTSKLLGSSLINELRRGRSFLAVFRGRGFVEVAKLKTELALRLGLSLKVKG